MNSFVKPLLRIASLQGREVLESLVTGQFSVVAGGGKVMTQATATNKSFTFTIDQNLTASKIMEYADEALAWYDSHTPDELAAFLVRRASQYAINRYGSC